MTIEPDTKDWTWVLDRRCLECGFDAAAIAVSDVAPGIRANAATWADILRSGPRSGDVRERPTPGIWSPLEYACHVRDVLRLYERRLDLMLSQDDPLYANWDQDETAVSGRYGEADPTQVAKEIFVAARTIADRFAGLAGADWSRPGRRSDGAAFTVDSFSRYLLHDLVHHVHDVRPVRSA